MKNARCPECGGDIVIDESSGEEVCASCGYVMSESAIDSSQDWREYSLEEHSGRSHAAPMLSVQRHTGAGGTYMGFERTASVSEHARFRRLRRRDSLSHYSSRTRSMSLAISSILRLGDELTLSDVVVSEAISLFQKCVEFQIVKGRSITEVCGACIYLACKRHNFARTLKNIGYLLGASSKSIFAVISVMHKRLSLAVEKVNPSIYVSKALSQLQLHGEVDLLSSKILSYTEKNRMCIGKSPVGVACAAVYIACKLNDVNVTQGQISRVLEVTEVTLRNVYKYILSKIVVEVRI